MSSLRSDIFSWFPEKEKLLLQVTSLKTISSNIHSLASENGKHYGEIYIYVQFLYMYNTYVQFLNPSFLGEIGIFYLHNLVLKCPLVVLYWINFIYIYWASSKHEGDVLKKPIYSSRWLTGWYWFITRQSFLKDFPYLRVDWNKAGEDHCKEKSVTFHCKEEDTPIYLLVKFWY